MRYHLALVGACLGLLRAPVASAQSVHKHSVQVDATPATPGARPSQVYYQLSPARQVPKGLLVLLPGRGEPAKHVLRATRLGREAAQRGFVVVVLALNNRVRLDEASQRGISAVIEQVVRQHPALARRLVLGGFSAGGQLAVAYAERLVQDSAHVPWRVRAVLGVDPPLDLAEHWRWAQHHLAQQDCPTLQAGDHRIVADLTQALGGAPAQFPGAYRTWSAFTRQDAAGGNAQWLRTVPVRVYCEPDLAFWQQHYCAALQATDLNADRASAFIASLQRQGNTQAHYIQTINKGYEGKQRMPHSWSIVEAAECAAWLQQCIQ